MRWGKTRGGILIRRSPRGSLAEWSVWVRATGVLLALIAFAALAFGSAEASAAPTFPTSPLLDNFTTDTSLVASPTSWTTPALDGGTMGVVPVAGSDDSRVDRHRHLRLLGRGDLEPAVHISGRSLGDDQSRWHQRCHARCQRDRRSLWHDSPLERLFRRLRRDGFGRIDQRSIPLADRLARSQATRLHGHRTQNLNSGDEIGLSVSSTGVLIAWYRPSGGSWSAVVSWRDRLWQRQHRC